MDQILRILVGAQQIARTSQPLAGLFSLCQTFPEVDCRDILVLFALLSIVIWPTNSFLSRPAWAPANGLVSIAAATSYPTKLSMLSVVLIAPHRCIITVSALIC